MKKESQIPEDTSPLNEDSALWRLLGSASESKAGPMFSRHVMHQVRTDSRKHNHWLQTLTKSWGFAFASGSAAACIILFLLSMGFSLPNNSPIVGQQFSEKQVEYDPFQPSSEQIPLYEFEINSDSQKKLIVAAAESPESFTDEDVAALIF